jgi:hypothetical protein
VQTESPILAVLRSGADQLKNEKLQVAGPDIVKRKAEFLSRVVLFPTFNWLEKIWQEGKLLRLQDEIRIVELSSDKNFHAPLQLRRISSSAVMK